MLQKLSQKEIVSHLLEILVIQRKNLKIKFLNSFQSHKSYKNYIESFSSKFEKVFIVAGFEKKRKN